MNTAVESALVVLIPEAEAPVAVFRERYDAAAALGMPAHVAVLYPFRAPRDISPDVVRRLTELFARIAAFEVTPTETARFPEVLYLAPTPDEPFRRLTGIRRR